MLGKKCAHLDMAAIPSERVRSLADMVQKLSESFTDTEKFDLLAMIAPRVQLDAANVQKILASTNGNISDAAKKLGVARRTLQNRMRDFNMPTGKRGRRTK